MGQSSVKSAERTMEVLSYLNTQARPVLASSIARRFGLPKSSTYHLLNVMRDRGFVTYFPEERAWGLGPVARDMGSGMAGSEAITRLARPLVRALAEASGEPATIGILHGREVLVLERADAPGPSTGGPVRGERVPAHLAALGRALLAGQADACIRRMFPTPPDLPLRTDKGPRRTDDLIAIVARSRQAGYATEEGEIRRTDAGVAAPIFDHLGEVVAAVGVTFWPRSRDGRGRAHLVSLVVDTASVISERIGYRPALVG